MLLDGKGKLTTSKSKSSTLWYILVINLFSSIVISKSAKNTFMASYTSGNMMNKAGINIFGTYKIIDVIHVTYPNITYICTIVNFFAILKLSGDLELTSLSLPRINLLIRDWHCHSLDTFNLFKHMRSKPNRVIKK